MTRRDDVTCLLFHLFSRSGPAVKPSLYPQYQEQGESHSFSPLGPGKRSSSVRVSTVSSSETNLCAFAALMRSACYVSERLRFLETLSGIVRPCNDVERIRSSQNSPKDVRKSYTANITLRGKHAVIRVAMTTGKDQSKYCTLIGQNLSTNSLALETSNFLQTVRYTVLYLFMQNIHAQILIFSWQPFEILVIYAGLHYSML